MEGIKINPHDLDMVAFKSNRKVLATNAIIAVDTAMQSNYSALKSQVITHLDPVIVVENNEKGGTFTLIFGGNKETVQPVPEVFELVKSISHVPLGIYSIIAPYLKFSEVTDWVPPLKTFRDVIKNALSSLEQSDLSAKSVKSCSSIINLAIEFIDHIIKKGHFTIAEFQKFTTDAAVFIQNNMEVAAEAQVVGVEALMKRWKHLLGEQNWKNLYAVVLAIWTTELRNQNWIILKHEMHPENVESHLITISTAEPPSNPVEVALDNLARIVQDNIAAAMIFPANSVLANSLKGPEDLLSNAIDRIIGCPHKRAV